MGKTKTAKNNAKEDKSVFTGIGLFFLAVVILLSFVNINDRNMLGPFGVIIERITYFALGRAAYVLPFIVFLYGLNIIRKNYKYNDSKAALGFTMLTCTIAIFLSLTSNNFDPVLLTSKFETFPAKQINIFYSTKGLDNFWKEMQPALRIMGKYDFFKGGMIGTYAAKFLIKLFSIVGAHIVNVVFFVVAVILVNKEDFLLAFFKLIIEIFSRIFQGGGNIFGIIFGALSGAFGALFAPGKTRKAQKPQSVKPRNGKKEDNDGDVEEEKEEEEDEDEETEEEREKPKKEKLTVITPEAKQPKAAFIQVIKRGDYTLPSTSLLKMEDSEIESVDYKDDAARLEKTLKDFGVDGQVVNVVDGPVISRFEVALATGTKISKVENLADDIALVMKVEQVRIASVPDKALVGIEIPKRNKKTIYLKELIEDESFIKASSLLTMAIGKDLGGSPIVADLTEMPHLLIAGATGSGKSVCINSIIMSILYKATPDEVKVLLVDPKRVELMHYNDLPHLISPVITDAKKAALALRVLVREMESRYDTLSKEGARNITAYNKLVEEFNADASKDKDIKPEEMKKSLPYIVLIIDELADLMTLAKNSVEASLQRLAQMARGVGIHLVLATQRPSVDIITGVIKANFPSRIAFQVVSKVDSRTILDMNGADALLGKGDMLYAPANLNKPIRGQAAFLSTNEVSKVVHFIKKQRKPDISDEFNFDDKDDLGLDDIDDEGVDDSVFAKALALTKERGEISTSYLQRKLSIGYSKAARLIDDMEEKGIITGADGNKPRKYIGND